MRSSFDGWARMLIRMDIGPWMLSRATVENFRIDSHIKPIFKSVCAGRCTRMGQLNFHFLIRLSHQRHTLNLLPI
jgi:hypothetical protein